MDASDAHCRPCPRSRLSWCCALFGCSSRERARGGNRSERVWELRGRCVELLACLLAVSKVSGSTSAVQPRLVPKEEGSSSQSVSCSFCLCVCLSVCVCLVCLTIYVCSASLSLSLLVHVSLFCLDELLAPRPLATHSSLLTYTHPSSYSSPARAHSSSARSVGPHKMLSLGATLDGPGL